MNNRKAFLSIEMLLIVGALVTGLALAFRFYFGIQENMRQINLVQDIQSVLLNLDIQEKKFKGFPNEEVGELFIHSKLYDADEGILKVDTANQWAYYTIPLTKFDNHDYSSGAILIKINEGSYLDLPEITILNTLKQSCLNAIVDYELSGTLTIDKIYGPNDWCLINDSVKIFQDPNL